MDGVFLQNMLVADVILVFIMSIALYDDTENVFNRIFMTKESITSNVYTLTHVSV